MHNLSDQELDRLSKEAAENFEASPPPMHWDKLRQRLDVEMPQEKKDNKRIYWLFSLSGLLLLLFTVGVIVMNNPLNLSIVQKPANNVSSLLNTPDHKVDDKNKNSKITQINHSEIDLKLPETAPGNLSEPSMASIDTYEKVPAMKPATPIIKGSKKTSKLFNAPIKKQGSKSESSINHSMNSSRDASDNLLTDPAGQTEKNVFATTGNVDSQLMKKTEKTDPVSVSAATDTRISMPGEKESAESIVKAADNVNKKPMQLKRWELSAVVGPDYSNVGFASPGKVGINIGLMAGYRIAERISVQTGLLYSQKHYTAVGDAYKRFPGYNINNTNFKMQWVDANCYMWDLPVNIRYDFLLRKKQRAFISVGLSSYFMKKEDLHYYYTYNNNPGYKEWLNQENSNYWMSALNLSVGFEQRISEQFSLQAEPFIKFPTSEIGYGKVSLNSLGIFLSFKYTPSQLHLKKQGKR